MARLGLTQLPGRLAELTGQPAPTYRKCFDAAVEARFPSQFRNGRWTVDEEHVPQIAAAMGMVVDKPVKPKRRDAVSSAA